MQIVINIPKAVFNEIVSADDASHLSRIFLEGSYLYFKEALQNGTPLPKGHGRLIDADAYREKMYKSREFNFFATLDMQSTIIEADKEVDK